VVQVHPGPPFLSFTSNPEHAQGLYPPNLSSRARPRGKICRGRHHRSVHSCRVIRHHRVRRLQVRELAIIAESAGLATGMHFRIKPRLPMPIGVWGAPTARKRKKIRES